MYDIIIIGGGIAGLYSAYKLLNENNTLKILILEKENRLGGRIHTVYDQKMGNMEAGGARFHENQPLIKELIRELGLGSKIQPISGSAVYIPANGSGKIQNSLLDAVDVRKGGMGIGRAGLGLIPPLNVLMMSFLDIFLGRENIPNAGLIAKIILASKGENERTLRNTTFLKYGEKVLNPGEIKYIEDSFGYYSELVMMNAYDAIALMENHLTPSNQFYTLNGGLQQVIENLEHKILKYKNVKILRKRAVKSIRFHDSEFSVQCAGIDTVYTSRICICAVPKQVLENLTLFRPVYKLLKKIECGSLCRIYCQFEKKGQVWFHNLPKMTTNNNLRMVIPINSSTGLIMLSYTDNRFAEYWNELYNKKGIKEVERELMVLIKETTGKDNIPYPIKTVVYHWGCGVGYWGVGADSKMISERMVNGPIENIPRLFVCGEHYSSTNQQWIEGALETSMAVVKNTHIL